ncbi:MAG: hypothetical protein K9J75_07120, partial [Cyanobium usitatum Tobar12.5m-G36]|nr:hypothetical protein [Cyanobium usitatum Tobar12.5m-G36]
VIPAASLGRHAAADLVVLKQLPVCRRHVVAAWIGMDQASMVAAIPSGLPVGQNPRWFLAFNPQLIRPMISFSGF